MTTSSAFWLRRLAITSALCTACACATSERKANYNTDLSPRTTKEGIILQLISFDQTSKHLRAKIIIENGSQQSLELPAKDLATTWLTVVVGAQTITPTVSYAIKDPDQDWPVERPLRRTVTIDASQSSATYALDCTFNPELPSTNACPTLAIHGLLGADKTPLDISIQIPAAEGTGAKNTP
jgi:hypothetical protein